MDNLSEVIKGKGLEVSESPSLSGVRHEYIAPDNFYTLKEFAEMETLDYIYSKNLINETKFFKILLKEWSYACRVGGKIVIDMENNEILDFEGLIDAVKLVLGENVKIFSKVSAPHGGTLVLEKTANSLEKKDDMSKWTFGILSDGTKEDVLNKQIDTIRALKIPNCEIIVCGNTKPMKNKRKGIKYIHFHPGVAWITKQKNIICENAKYENIVVTHNRFNFDKNWYKGMKKYGNYFEVLVCKIHDPKGRRAGDWLTYGREISDRWIHEMGLLDYRDWDENGIINGSFYILKKSTWKKCPWDEKRVWGQAEDDFLSLEFQRKGIVPRFNQYSTAYTFPERYGEWHWRYDFNPESLGRIHTDSWKRWLRRRLDRFLRSKFNIGFVTRLNCNTYGW